MSKEVSYALRHAPWEYELEIDENGWVSTQQLIDALNENPKWKNIKDEDLEKMIKMSDKKRHELVSGKIRALYGHSIPYKIVKKPQEPPEILYHGTAECFLAAIMENGLLPRKRQYVHLSTDTETAFEVGKRRDNKPVILSINAKQAWSNGIAFYQGNGKVWLANEVPCKYIHLK